MKDFIGKHQNLAFDFVMVLTHEERLQAEDIPRWSRLGERPYIDP